MSHAIAFYARTSLLHPDTLDDQVATLRAYAAAQGWAVDDATFYIDERVTDADLDRPGLNDLRAAVRTVAGGQALLSPSVTTRVVDRALTGRTADPGAARIVADLTEREREVLVEIARGATNDELAATLFISPATARTYVSRLLTKLDARDRVALVLLAHRAGLA